ncbi:MAG: UDP-N-acetylmuramoyl-L-alanyl-D-glutamate--2,6-diaminopimelate ligase [Acidimicrobiales bacterium]|nr:UDP-N-acetylmuramoyl-L-alanyl-D-glutamate--2,6-diaminopimelate ligase [Acidimicrobiales bacterium]
MAATTLTDLVADVNQRVPGLLTPHGDLEGRLVQAISDDSRRVEEGTLFFAIRGEVVDGHDYIEAVADAGGVAVVAEDVRTERIPTLLAESSRVATAHTSAAFHGHPSAEIQVVAVTGTNGKTSIVNLIEHLVRHAGRTAESFGTLTGTLTTAAAPRFQERLRSAADSGVTVVAAEVSSHALDQHRVDGTTFAIGIFTNLTQDHLDYHATMEAYFQAKARLFSMCEVAIIDVSNEWGRRLADLVDIPTIEVDATAETADLRPNGSSFDWQGQRVSIPLGGRFNVSNAILAAEAALCLGLEVDDVVAGLVAVPQIPGRFEWVAAGQLFGIVVDYSHTPAGLEAAIATARELIPEDGRVFVVFGAGGDRDPGKRPMMGAASLSADVVIVTSDNPRTEDPGTIIDHIFQGIDMSADATIVREVDRRAAIGMAIADAREGDIVVIAGKGHEQYQIIGETRHEFDDRLVARSAVNTIAEAGRA